MQQQYQFLTSYKDHERYRQSFHALSQSTFGIDFEGWYQKGFWTEKYQPYSYLDGETVIANVSVNHLNLVINQEKKRAIQIGTVMTHPDYRNKGLSASLMNRILDEYEGMYDIMYLFANSTVLDFYPKFGFERVDQYQFSLLLENKSVPKEATHTVQIRKLDGHSEEDLRFLYDFAKRRVPVSKTFASDNVTELFMFYCMYVFPQDIYYFEYEEVIVIYQQKDDTMHLYDIVSLSEIDMLPIIQKLALTGTTEVVFHFTPDIDATLNKKIYHGDGALFVRIPSDAIQSNPLKLPEYVKHPLTTQT